MGKMTEKVACTPLGPQTKLPQLLAVSWVCPLLMNFQVPLMTDEESPRYYALLHNTGVWATVGETPGGERPHLNTTGQLLLCSWCSWQCHLLGLQDWSTCLSTLTQLLLCLWMINVQVMSPPTSFTLLKMIKRRLLSAQAKWYSDKFRRNSLRDRFIMYQKTTLKYFTCVGIESVATLPGGHGVKTQASLVCYRAFWWKLLCIPALVKLYRWQRQPHALPLILLRDFILQNSDVQTERWKEDLAVC